MASRAPVTSHGSPANRAVRAVIVQDADESLPRGSVAMIVCGPRSPPRGPSSFLVRLSRVARVAPCQGSRERVGYAYDPGPAQRNTSSASSQLSTSSGVLCRGSRALAWYIASISAA
ncbi:hypothetical protein JCM4814A_87730 [Streptomyces phaeofaciens JCM 4814]|uniref:Uncharacterized protein n=1 Tax=Streptomyces phaeofaciens TaxID=68254 RepID=A0A918LTD9_9ACTN|nr:hypothetical protein GCM10010226_29080 [Streptomyces phaeofaciens]